MKTLDRVTQGLKLLEAYLYEEVAVQDIEAFLQEIFDKLEKASGKLSKRQLTTLKHEVYTLIGEEVKIMELLDPTLNLFPKFKRELTNQLYLAFRGVDDEALTTFLTSLRQDGPIITPAVLNIGKTQKVKWEIYVRERLASKVSPEDIEDLIDAMHNTYEVYKGGSAGMGKGELQYALLCGGSKPQSGDLAVPGFGELELKGPVGRLKGLKAAIGSPGSAYSKVKQRYMQEPELQDLLPVLENPNTLTLNKKSSGDVFYKHVNKLIPPDRLLDLYTDVTRIYMETLYRTALSKGYSLNQDLIAQTGEALAQGDLQKAIACQAAIQYAVYQEADGFDGVLAIDPSGFVFLEDPEDLITAAETGAINITPASMKDTIGAAAGITVKKG